jgi:hypothetical protein
LHREMMLGYVEFYYSDEKPAGVAEATDALRE